MTSSRRSSSVNWRSPSFESTMTPRTASSKTSGSEEHRLVEVVLRPRDRHRAGVVGGVGEVLGDAVRCHPARDPLAEPDPQLVRRLVDELADEPPHGDRHEPAVVPEAIDAHVVVRDELVELVGDRAPRSRSRSSAGPGERRAAGSTGGGRSTGRHLLVVLGVLDGGAGLGREPGQRRHLLLGPGVGAVVVHDRGARAPRPRRGAAPRRSCRSPPGRSRTASRSRAGRRGSRVAKSGRRAVDASAEQRSGRDVADRRQVPRRQPARDLRGRHGHRAAAGRPPRGLRRRGPGRDRRPPPGSAPGRACSRCPSRSGAAPPPGGAGWRSQREAARHGRRGRAGGRRRRGTSPARGATPAELRRR